MKRILCLIDSLGPGGAQRQLVGLATLLKEQGYDVTVACYHDNRFYVDMLLSNHVNYVYLESAEKTTFRVIYIARYIRKLKPDVVISYLETPSICACVSRFFNPSFKLIVSERNTTQSTTKNEVVRFNLFRKANHVVPNSFAQEYYIKKNFPFLIYKVTTIPNFVDLQRFIPPFMRERKKIPEIVVAATIWEPKNALGFIDTVAKLKDSGIHFHVSWYGKVDAHLDYYNQCQHKVHELGISDCIDFKEKTQQICEKYQKADYFCLPSFYEGTPNVICEAMACGLPIACSDICDNGRYVKDGVNGILFNPLDSDSMALAIKKILSLNENEYRNYCSNSREIAETLLSKEMFIQSYISLIEQ